MTHKISTYKKSPINAKGFTIVELVVVVVIIAILAGIAIVGYSLFRKQTIETAMKHDLQTAQTAIGVLKAGKKNYPVSADDANGGKGLPSSGNNQLLYIGGSNSFCLIVKNPSTNEVYNISVANPTPTTGSCGPFVGTIAGTGAQYSGDGYVDGPGSVARFSQPMAMAIDSNGLLYIADGGNYRIRSMTQDGIVSTVAGSGGNGAVDGPAATAQFRWPDSIAVAPDGTLFVADSNGHTIRKVTTAGVVSTIAGSGVAGFANGTGTAAQFNYPEGIAISPSGDLYVADSSNNRLRRVTQAGVVTTVAGSGTYALTDGTGASASFRGPNDVVVDDAGIVYVVDNNSVRKVATNGAVTTLAGTSSLGSVDGNGSAARFNWPTGIDIDRATGNLYVVDKSSGLIRKVTPTGTVTTLAGTVYTWDAIDGPGASAAFAWPDDILYVEGKLYISDTDNSRIRVMIE